MPRSGGAQRRVGLLDDADADHALAVEVLAHPRLLVAGAVGVDQLLEDAPLALLIGDRGRAVFEIAQPRVDRLRLLLAQRDLLVERRRVGHRPVERDRPCRHRRCCAVTIPCG
jgi:hypothetical protein